MANCKNLALDAFLVTKSKVEADLVLLKNQVDDHFKVDPEKVNWGHVADLGRLQEALNEITDEI